MLSDKIGFKSGSIIKIESLNNGKILKLPGRLTTLNSYASYKIS